MAEQRPGAAAPESGGGTAYLELQIHPSDIQSGVRYLFLTRRQVTTVVGPLMAYLMFLGIGLSLVPGVLGDLLRSRQRAVLEQERDALGERLAPMVGQLEELEAQTGELRSQMDRVYLAYGLDPTSATAQGGYPAVVTEVPESTYQEGIQKGLELSARLDEQHRVLDVFLHEIQDFEQARTELTLTTPAVSPLKRDDYVLTSPFGMRRHPFTNTMQFHSGVDLAALTGTEILAPSDGLVVFAGLFPKRRSIAWWRYGNLVVLRHGEDFISIYAHCDRVLVQKGQRVEQGDVIATVGDTGFSTNPHLHYEIRRRSADGELEPVDPRIYMLNVALTASEKSLVARRESPSADQYEPLPRIIAR